MLTFDSRRATELRRPLQDGGVERVFERNGSDRGAARVHEIEGALPALPDGTWYLNGPGRFDRGGLRYGHWLDGDGLIRAMTFRGGEVSFASRFVRTRKFAAEEGAGRPLFRTFGSTFAGDRLNERGTALETPANVSIVNYAGMLLALGEQGEPWRIDPDTLEASVPFDAFGAITPITPFAAHAKVDAITGEMFNFGVSFSERQPTLHVFRFDATGRQVFRSRVPLHCSCTIHDFALGPTLAVFYASPFVLNFDRIRRGSSVMQSLEWRPELGTRVIIVSRGTGELIASIPAGDRYCLHTINCFEVAGLVILDVIEMPRPIYDAYAVPRLFDRPIESVPVRLFIDPAEGRIISRRELRGGRAPEFPALEQRSPMRHYESFWALDIARASSSGPKFYDRLTRFEWYETGEPDTAVADEGTLFGGEPTVLRDEAGGVWAICQVFETTRRRGGFAVFDAFQLHRGPVARVWLDIPTPMAFHGVFVGA